MKNFFAIIVALIVAAILILYMVTFQVRYDQVAVLTTFDKADPQTSLKTEPGIYRKWPAPLSKAYIYSTRTQLLDVGLRQVQTKDGQSVIVQMYLAWKINEPYDFYSALKNVANAEEQLKNRLKDLTGIITQYNFDQLVNTDTSKLALVKIETKCAQTLRQQLAGSGFGIEIQQVGLRRLVLPEATTEKVFERMRSTRERMAEDARSEGGAAALKITAAAEGAQTRILAFAQRRAQAIKDEGDHEAAGYYGTFNEDEKLAIMLRHIQALKQTLAEKSTFILDADDLGIKYFFQLDDQ
jgi:membrane protease subunit HflC